MSVDCNAVSGYGIYIEKDHLKKIINYTAEDEEYNFLEVAEFGLEKYKCVECLEYGSKYSDDDDALRYVLVATDPINNLEGFLSDLEQLGIHKSKKDIQHIQEVLWC